MQPINRRSFIRGSVLAAAAISAARERAATAQTSASISPPGPLGIVDTNVSLFDWPFRKLKYRDTSALAAKLKKHRVISAWAGSYEALLHKDMHGVNARLAEECAKHGGGLLIPFGSVNLAWPDWEEDVRRCHEVHGMRGIRIYPGYQPFNLDHPDAEKLVQIAAERDLILQIAFGMEDPRVHHPIIQVGTVSFGPLLKLVKANPKAKIQLLHFSAAIKDDELSALMANSNAFMDISRLESNGMIGRMLGAGPDAKAARVPLSRLVFGSHAPYFPLETALLKLVESPLSTEQLEAIMQGNARRILEGKGVAGPAVK